MNLPNQFASLHSPLFRRYWLGSLASVGGWQLLFLGQGWLIFEMTHSPLYLGYLGAASALPNMALALFGGTLADRYDKRSLLIGMSGITCALLMLLTWLDWSEQIEVWHVLTIAALSSLVQGLDMPTRQALFPHLIDRSQMSSAVAMTSIVWQGTRMIMPALGGVVLALSDTYVLFGLAAIGTLLMLFSLFTLPVRVPGVRHESAIAQTLEGFQYILRTRLFLVLIGLAFASSFFGISYMQMMPALVVLLEANEHGYGVLVSATGVGSVLGTLLAPRLTQDGPIGQRMLWSAAGSAGCIMLLATVCALAAYIPGAFYVAVTIAIVGSAVGSLFFVVSMTVLQLAVPDTLRGRVMGVHSINFSLMPLGGLFTGAIAASTGAAWAVVIAASLYLLSVAYVAATQPQITRLAPALPR